VFSSGSLGGSSSNGGCGGLLFPPPPSNISPPLKPSSPPSVGGSCDGSCGSSGSSPSPYVLSLFITLMTFPLFVPMVCRNICLRIYSKIVVGQSHYSVGKKYCRRCGCYFITKNIFCQCCGMQLRGSPAEREYKEKLDKERKRKLRIVLKPP